MPYRRAAKPPPEPPEPVGEGDEVPPLIGKARLGTGHDELDGAEMVIERIGVGVVLFVALVLGASLLLR